MSEQPRELRIIQYNVWKSADKVMIEFMAREEVRSADILAIQEPWRNRRNGRGYNPSGGPFRMIDAGTGDTRVSVYLNRQIRDEDFEVLKVEPDLITIQLYLAAADREGGREKVLLHTAYNPPPESHTVREPSQQLQNIVKALDTESTQILLGDFNLHHPVWGGCTSKRHTLAGALLQATEEKGLSLLLPPGLITRDLTVNEGTRREHRRQTTIDLIFGSQTIAQRVVSCDVRRDLGTGSDHLPIETCLAIQPELRSQGTLGWAWKNIDIEAFQRRLDHRATVLPQEALTSKTQVNRYTDTLIDVIRTSAFESTPRARRSLYDRAFWTPECTLATQTASTLRWRAENTGDPVDKQNARDATNNKKRILRKAKAVFFREVMEKIAHNPKRIWQVNRWAKKRAQGLYEEDYFPTLQKGESRATSIEDKVGLLHQECFPPPPPVDLDDLEGFRYPKQLPCQDEISEEDVAKVVWRLKADKAPGSDEITNRVVKLTARVLGKQLAKLFTACLRLGYHPQAFRTAVTVVLRKPGKPDYSDPAAYRPIALLNTLGKVLESIVAGRISALAERYSLLPDEQYGARPGRSTEDALLNLQEIVQAEWTRTPKAVISILSLDVSKAFDRVSHERLLHNLRKRRIPDMLVNWVRSFLSDRETAFRIGAYTSPQRATSCGIPQGSPVSPILYLFYSSDLIEGCRQARNNASGIGFVDDINIIVYGESDVGNCRRLQDVYRHCEKWAQRHGSSFNISKYQLLHLAKTRKRIQASVTIDRIEIQPTTTLKLLGVHLDRTLSGKAHVKAIQNKVPVLIAALKTLSGSVWGAPLARCRQVYLQAIRPALAYGAVAWLQLDKAFSVRKGMAAKVQAIQGQCLRAVAGAYKATPTEALEAEVGVEPLDLYCSRKASVAATRHALSEAGKGTRLRVRAILTRRRKGKRRRARAAARASPLTRTLEWTTEKSGLKLEAQGASSEARKEKASEILGKVRKAVTLFHRTRWKERWEKGKKGAHSRTLQPQLQKQVLGLHKGLRKPLSSLIIQLRTGKVGLRAFLFQRRVPGVDDPNCDCGEEMTVEHVLLRCMKWSELRDLELEGQNRSSLRGLLGTRKGCLAAARLVQKTGLLAQFQKADMEGEEEDGRRGEEGVIPGVPIRA